MTETTAEAPGQQAFATLMLIFASVGFGSVAFFARSLAEAGIAPPVIAFFRFIIPAFAFAPLLVVRGPRARATAWGVFAGIVLGVGWIGYVQAISLMPVATAGVIYMTYPLFTVLFGWAVFSETPSLRAVTAAGLILAAATLAAGGAALSGGLSPVAVLFASASPAGMGMAIVILTHRLVVLPPLSRMAATALGATFGLLPLILTYPTAQIIPSSGALWMLLIGLSLAGALLPQLLFVVYAPRVGAAAAASASAAELPTMFLIAWMAFGEALTGPQIAAGAMVLAAILLTQSRRARNVTTHIAAENAPDQR